MLRTINLFSRKEKKKRGGEELVRPGRGGKKKKGGMEKKGGKRGKKIDPPKRRSEGGGGRGDCCSALPIIVHGEGKENVNEFAECNSPSGGEKKKGVIPFTPFLISDGGGKRRKNGSQIPSVQ